MSADSQVPKGVVTRRGAAARQLLDQVSNDTPLQRELQRNERRPATRRNPQRNLPRVSSSRQEESETGASPAAVLTPVDGNHSELGELSSIIGRRTRTVDVIEDTMVESETGASPAAVLTPVDGNHSELGELSSIIGRRTSTVDVIEDTMVESETGASPAAVLTPVDGNHSELGELSSIIGRRTSTVDVIEDTMVESETGASPAAVLTPVDGNHSELGELSSIIGRRTRTVDVIEDTMVESETGASPAAAITPVVHNDNELRELRQTSIDIFEDSMSDSSSRAPTPEPVRQLLTSCNTPVHDTENPQCDLVLTISSDNSWFVIEVDPNPARPSQQHWSSNTPAQDTVHLQSDLVLTISSDESCLLIEEASNPATPSQQHWSPAATCSDSTLTESASARPEPVPGPSRIRASSIASEPDDIAWEDICRVGTERTMTRGRRNVDLDNEMQIIMNGLKQLYDTYTTRPRPIRCADQPPAISTRMMPHQLEALAWMRWRETTEHPGGILADDMGLGKTVSVIALIASSNERASVSPRPSRPAGGTLVVCPVALVQHWSSEIIAHCAAQLRVEVHHGRRRMRDEFALAEAEVVITTYAVLQKESSVGGVLTRVIWNRAVLDEAHTVRNWTSATAKAAASLHAKHRWCVTGTPVQNKTTDLFSLVKFVGFPPFDDLRVWNIVFKQDELAGCRRLQILFRTIALRRTKENLKEMDQISSLPPKENHEWLFELTDAERTVYDSLQAKARALYTRYLRRRASSNESMDIESLDSSGSLPSEHEGCAAKTQDMLIMLLRLRQICCHCALLPKVSEEDDSCVSEAVRQVMAAPDPNGVFQESTPSSKIKKTMEIISDVLQRDEKILVISQWTSFLSIVKLHLDRARIRSNLYTGKLGVRARQHAINIFNNHPSSPNVMLLSLGAGGVGINLCGANHLLLLDPHWNPQLEEQARARIHRVGQTRPVHMHRLIAARTVEERVVWLQKKKLQLAETLLSAAEVSDPPALSTDDLTRLLLGED